MKIYTKTGDKGKTSLYGGKRVSKYDSRVNAYGTVDELNSILGIILSKSNNSELSDVIVRIQNELFSVGAELATPQDVNSSLKQEKISDREIQSLEIEIDAWQEQLPELTSFILPGGGELGSLIHYARSVCRRAERLCVEAQEGEVSKSEVIKYLNRLSDWLFILARKVNKEQNKGEQEWKS